jgi:hypothetical protein
LPCFLDRYCFSFKLVFKMLILLSSLNLLLCRETTASTSLLFVLSLFNTFYSCCRSDLWEREGGRNHGERKESKEAQFYVLG